MCKLIASLTLLLVCLPLTVQATDTEQANPCLDCHEVDPAQFAQTVHGLTECLDCHVGADSRQHRRGLDPVACGGCHAEILAEHALSVHGVDGERRSEGMELPSCASCHGDTHTMLAVTDPSSPMNESRQGETCGTCHGSGNLCRLACAQYARSKPTLRACMRLRSPSAIMERVAAIATRLIRHCRPRTLRLRYID